jgi:hypothetical protein
MDAEGKTVLAGVVIVALIICGFVYFLIPTDGEDKRGYGSWYRVENPPGLSDKHECWVWQAGIADSKHGGPVCFEVK